jgi:hypothetical protein
MTALFLAVAAVSAVVGAGLMLVSLVLATYLIDRSDRPLCGRCTRELEDNNGNR